ncbi:beta-galactosidase-1-like protein 2 [Hyalella azteca]|uniref:Beta-galactosidase n=1 Tax=Hyalella azteca TaxID=294128 RepID=A0A8B7NUH3_HYAAZ|nr:beta-galactosidase-1-like protein 2 [Hyalella azteca]
MSRKQRPLAQIISYSSFTMPRNLSVITFFIALTVQSCLSVTLYEYYVPDGVPSTGLVAEGETFTLNGKNLTIFSGSFHYFRVHPDYWRETFKKMRAAGLNTVQTYVPWNLHEPRQGEYDFGELGEDMSPFLDLRSFVQMAQEEDLFVLFRPGPYICSEWEFGGMPSWLQRDPTMHVRTYYDNYRSAVAAYFGALLPQVADLEFTEGGPIIAVQIENEYGNFGYDDEPRDHLYMNFLKNLTLSSGLDNSLLYTSDSPASKLDWGTLPGVLQTANFQRDAESNLSMLKLLQPNRPMMVTEFWSGWFDHWLADVHTDWDVDEFATTLDYILSHGSSVNFYMFIGGTNFGFMAGANAVPTWPTYAPIVTSYDYGAPLSEAGDYTEKYSRLVELIALYNPLNGIVDNPVGPAQRQKAAYGDFPVTEILDIYSLISQAPVKFVNDEPLNMEALDMNNGNGQSYGYLLYSTNVKLQVPQSELLIRGHVRDMAQVFVDLVVQTKPYQHLNDVNDFGFWNGRDKNISLPGTGNPADRLDILVENLGRVNYGAAHNFYQKKGLWEGDVLVDRERVLGWTMTPLEFKKSFVNGLTGWEPFTTSANGPAMYRTTVTLSSPPLDTFLDMRQWNKGVVFVNGFNVGRYWSVGPQRTLYVPAPLLVQGDNQITIFEQYTAASAVSFIDVPILS